MGVILVIAVIMGGIIAMSLSGAYLALKCPKCKTPFGLKWQEAHQRDICKNKDCDYMVYAKEFVPPKASYLKWLQQMSPLTHKKKEEEEE
jgi:phage FluMu protein Com